MRWLMWILIVLVAILFFLFWKNLSMPKTTGLVDDRLQPCPKSPNCVCCCPNDKDHNIAPLPYSSDDTLDLIESFLSRHYSAHVVQRTSDYLHVVVTTPLMRYKDDLEFMVDRQKDVVLVRSASRVGYGDGGVNRARIEALRAFLKSH